MFARRRPAGRLWAYGRLVRVPNLFTAPPDVFLGVALATSVGGSAGLPLAFGLAAASMALYAGGTALNDAFDAPSDALERPERPIPRGEVSRQRAFGVGATALLVGVGVAFVTAGTAAALTAGTIAVVVVLYDGVLKDTPAGFLAMGTTRGLNVVLGMAGAGAALDGPVRLAVPPLAVVGYIAAVTWMAASETDEGRRFPVAVAGAGMLLAVGAAVGFHAWTAPPLARGVVSLALAAVFLLWTGGALRKAYANPVPGTVGPAVGTCVLGLVVLDGAMAAVVGLPWALAATVFVVPATLLASLFDVS